MLTKIKLCIKCLYQKYYKSSATVRYTQTLFSKAETLQRQREFVLCLGIHIGIITKKQGEL